MFFNIDEITSPFSYSAGCFCYRYQHIFFIYFLFPYLLTYMLKKKKTALGYTVYHNHTHSPPASSFFLSQSQRHIYWPGVQHVFMRAYMLSRIFSMSIFWISKTLIW